MTEYELLTEATAVTGLIRERVEHADFHSTWAKAQDLIEKNLLVLVTVRKSKDDGQLDMFAATITPHGGRRLAEISSKTC